jgi:CheY-like chemotaxis protein
MVGEIRDSETASIAFQAGQTGHLVLSTLHTNDAPSAVIRLLDLGIPAFLISTSLITVVGQRLVRRVCPKCKTFDPLTPQILKQIPMYLDGAIESTFWKGIGCEACQYTGYSGRLGIFEVLMITPSLKEIIEPDVSTLTLRNAAEAEGFQSMTTDGIKKAMLGLTTIEEVYRVAPPEVRETSQHQLMEAFDFEETPTETHQPQMPLASVTGITHRKILVVDDDELTLRLLRNSLESENYLVITARSGSEAIKVVFQEKPDLIITDYVTQETDGIKLIKKLRSQLSTRFLPIIMLTVRDNLNHEVKGIAAGADDYIRKPINLRSVLIRVNRLLDRQPDKKIQGICGNQ